MFLDLDKPILKDPREMMEASMEWDAISEMYERRDEARRRTGFLKDLHEEKGFTLNPDTGRYRDAPGFNPPRRMEKKDYEDVPMEVRDMILDRLGGFKERTRTRALSRSHAGITRTLDEVLEEEIEGALEEVPIPRPSERSDGREAKIWMDWMLHRVSGRVFERLSIPLTVLPSGEDFQSSSITIVHGKVTDPTTREYEHELMFSCYNYGGSMDLQVAYHVQMSNETSPKGLWDHYPVIRKIVERICKRVYFIGTLRLDGPDEEYERFKRKMLKRAS